MRTLLLILAFTAVAAVGHAQTPVTQIDKEELNGFEISAGIFGAMGFHENLGIRNINTSTEDYQEVVCGSLLNGYGARVSALSRICNNAQVGLGFEYYRGCKTMTDESIFESGGNTFSYMDFAQYNRVSLIPQVVLESNREQEWSYYGQVGLVLPLIRNTIWTSEQTNSSGTAITTGIGKDKFSVGLNYGGGIQYNTDNYSVSAGLTGTQLVGRKVSFKYTSITNFMGEEEIDDYDIYSRETDYVERLDENSNNLQFNSDANLDMPREELVPKRSNHSYGLVLDVKFPF